MRTKIILHGGFSKTKGDVQKNDAFFREMLRGTPDEAKVLLVYFAEREEMVRSRTEQDKDQFNMNSGSKQLDFRVASEGSFETDCAWADVIYLHGGRTVKLMEALRKYPNIKELLSKRTISGDSAGANALAKIFYSKNSKVIGEGLGILPLKIVVHYQDGTPDPLTGVEPRLKTLFLHEYETKVFHL